MLPHEGGDAGGKSFFVISPARYLALRRSMLSEHANFLDQQGTDRAQRKQSCIHHHKWQLPRHAKSRPDPISAQCARITASSILMHK